MKVSLNIVKQFTDVAMSVDDLVSVINKKLGSVDEVIDVGARYKDVIVARIVHAEKHPKADRLQVCKIDDNGIRQGVERDEDGLVQVVCGAPNARAGILVAWLPPEATVPASHSDKEPFVLSSRELRGVISHGMLASGAELGIGSDSDGILEIAADEWKPSGIVATAGASFAEIYGLDDTVIDIENKMFTHRPDLFGQLGVAREIAAITSRITAVDEGFVDTRFENPDWYHSYPRFESGDESLPLTVDNEAPGKVPRLMATVIAGVTVGQSPLWLQCALTVLGAKPVNNIVDATNYMMLITAQPIHAYDYDTLRGKSLGARLARTGEKVTLLNHKTYELHQDDIVIVDGEGPIGLAGVMGGADSEVSVHTKNIVLESATFDMYTVRKTSMRHGLFTDAVTRFNKGQSPLQNDRVLLKLMTLIKDIAGGSQANRVFDEPAMSSGVRTDSISEEIAVGEAFINARLGTDLTQDQMGNLLRRANFAAYPAEDNQGMMMVSAPFWRTDIELPEDIVEEVGRLYGFDKLPRELPSRSVAPAPQNVWRELAQTMRTSLARAGANEVLTYSFVHEDVLLKAGQDPAMAYRLSNALSPDLQYYRLSLTPSLLDKVHMNIKAGIDEFALFEIGKGHSKQAEVDEDGLPVELSRLGFVYAAKTARPGAPYYRAKAHVAYLAKSLGLTLEYKPLPASSSLVFAAPFEPKRSARVVDVVSGQSIGVVGEYKQSVATKFKLPAYSAGFELLPEAVLLTQAHRGQSYVPSSRYPSAERDICFQVDEGVSYQQIIDGAMSVLSEHHLSVHVTPVDIYQAEHESAKNITIRLEINAADKTLTNDEVTALVDAVALAVSTHTGAAVL